MGTRTNTRSAATTAPAASAAKQTAAKQTAAKQSGNGSRRPGMAEVNRMARERLMDRDQRYTTGRRRLVEVLAGAGAPVTLPTLLAMAPDLSQSSAYRNLALMEEAGVVRRLVHGAEHAHYELAEDLTEHHHHLICEECGLITDITLEPALERSLDRAFDGLAEQAGFSPRHHALDVFGRCADCAA